jgi:hypothetical protein
MNHTLKVTNIAEPGGIPCRLELDRYVPMRFRTYEGAIGAALVRLGNYKTTLLELHIEPPSGMLRGLTVTCYDELAPWPTLAVTSTVRGLPELAVRLEGAKRLDLVRDFQVSVQAGEVLVYWDEVRDCQATTFADRVQCLIHDMQLSGVRFIGLTDHEVTLFASHARTHGRSR